MTPPVPSEDDECFSRARGHARIRNRNIIKPFVGVVRGKAPRAHHFRHQAIGLVDGAHRVIHELPLAQFPFGKESLPVGFRERLDSQPPQTPVPLLITIDPDEPGHDQCGDNRNCHDLPSLHDSTSGMI
jgi:hypothetical protein